MSNKTGHKLAKITLTKSVAKATIKQKRTIVGLGLRKINSSSDLLLTPEIKGMIKVVRHVVSVTEK